jgi:Mce-associated membrane protein
VLVTAGLGVVVLLLWVAGAVLFAHNRSVDELAAQRPVVLDAAKKVATDLTSIGAQNAEAQIKSLTEESTGEFQKQLSTYAAALQAVLTQSQAAATGTVSGAAIERVDHDSASALVTVDAKLSSRAAAQSVSYRLAVQLRNVDGRWLASDVNFVG